MATVTRSQLRLARLRSSQQDAWNILDALAQDGELTVEDDPEPEPAEPQLDEEGNPLKDADGNEILQEPERVPPSENLVIEREGEEEQELTEEQQKEWDAAQQAAQEQVDKA